MVHNIEFKRANTVFQNQLNKDINMINKDPLYKVSRDNYSKLLQDNVTKSYKKSTVTLINNINKEAKANVAELKLDDRIKQFNQRKAFATLKNHKVNFQNDPKFRLVNPAKSEIGIISKHYLDFINNKIRKKNK